MTGNPTWKKGGSSPNPGGRSKEQLEKLKALADANPRHARIITDALAKLLNTKIPNDAQGRNYAEAIAAVMVSNAIKGDLAATKEITDRIEGRPVSIAVHERAPEPSTRGTQERISLFIEKLSRTAMDPETPQTVINPEGEVTLLPGGKKVN